MLMPAIIAGSIIAFYLYLAVYFVPAGHIITISRFRVPNRKGRAGINVIIPFIERVDSRVSTGNNKIVLNDYVIYSSDGIPVEIDVDVRYRITDPIRFTYYYLPSSYDFETTIFSTIGKVTSSYEIDQMMRCQKEFLDMCLSAVRNELVGSGVMIDELLFLKIDYPPSVLNRNTNINEYDSPTIDNRNLQLAHNRNVNEAAPNDNEKRDIKPNSSWITPPSPLPDGDDSFNWLESTLPPGGILALDNVVPNSNGKDDDFDAVSEIVPNQEEDLTVLNKSVVNEEERSWLDGTELQASNSDADDDSLAWLDRTIAPRNNSQPLSNNKSSSIDYSLGWLDGTIAPQNNDQSVPARKITDNDGEPDNIRPHNGDESFSWLDLTFSDESDETHTIVHTHNSLEAHNNLSWLESVDAQNNVNQARENIDREGRKVTLNTSDNGNKSSLSITSERPSLVRNNIHPLSNAENTLARGEHNNDIQYYEMRTASGFTIYSHVQDPGVSRADMTSISCFETTIGDNSINSDICLEIAMLEQELIRKQRYARSD